LDLALLRLQEVVESSMLSSALALIPIFSLFKAHSGIEFFSFDAIYHSLVVSVARVRLHVHGIKWLHNELFLFILN
jgi:hypothetical protein